MDVYEALYTTRAMRRCRPDPIPIDAQQRVNGEGYRANNRERQMGKD